MKLNKEIRKIIFDKYLGKCAYCGCELRIDNFEVDHYLPKHKGGADSYMNLMPACRNCNIAKKTYTIKQWRIILQNKIKELEKFGDYNQSIKFGLIKETGKKIEFFFESDYNGKIIISQLRGLELFNKLI